MPWFGFHFKRTKSNRISDESFGGVVACGNVGTVGSIDENVTELPCATPRNSTPRCTERATASQTLEAGSRFSAGSAAYSGRVSAESIVAAPGYRLSADTAPAPNLPSGIRRLSNDVVSATPSMSSVPTITPRSVSPVASHQLHGPQVTPTASTQLNACKQGSDESTPHYPLETASPWSPGKPKAFLFKGAPHGRQKSRTSDLKESSRSSEAKGNSQLQASFQCCAVVRHCERADDLGSLYHGQPWTQTDGFKRWPKDPPLSDAGRKCADEIGSMLFNYSAANDTTFHVVVSSPYYRCVQTAVAICGRMGRGCTMVIDNALGEIYGPKVMGDYEPIAVTRPSEQTVMLAQSRDVRLGCGHRALGKWPMWPEDLQQARERFATRFLEYLQRGASAKQIRNFVLVTHADGVGAALSVMPSTHGSFVEKVQFGGCFFAWRSARLPKGAPGTSAAGHCAGRADPAKGLHLTPTGDLLMDFAGAPATEGGTTVVPPKAKDGWHVAMQGIEMRSKRECHFTFSRRVRDLANKLRSRVKVEHLLGELPDRQLAETLQSSVVVSKPAVPKNVAQSSSSYPAADSYHAEFHSRSSSAGSSVSFGFPQASHQASSAGKSSSEHEVLRKTVSAEMSSGSNGSHASTPRSRPMFKANSMRHLMTNGSTTSGTLCRRASVQESINSSRRTSLLLSGLGITWESEAARFDTLKSEAARGRTNKRLSLCDSQPSTPGSPSAAAGFLLVPDDSGLAHGLAHRRFSDFSSVQSSEISTPEDSVSMRELGHLLSGSAQLESHGKLRHGSQERKTRRRGSMPSLMTSRHFSTRSKPFASRFRSETQCPESPTSPTPPTQRKHRQSPDLVGVGSTGSAPSGLQPCLPSHRPLKLLMPKPPPEIQKQTPPEKQVTEARAEADSKAVLAEKDARKAAVAEVQMARAMQTDFQPVLASSLFQRRAERAKTAPPPLSLCQIEQP